MKKATIILLVIFLLVLSIAISYIILDVVNNSDNAEQTANNEEQIVNNTTNEIDQNERIEELEARLRGNLPTMDGSTSTIPIEGGIIAAFEGITQEEAEAKVQHSTTYGSFDNLLDGKCDIIFTPLLSDEQKAEAEERGIELEAVPIVKEAFVFVLNANNSVDTLTQDQIRGIYTGNITNWKQLGGDNAEIIPYQRDETSGSQNFMKIFMNGYNLIEAKKESILETMNSILDVIAGYDNGKYSIGYSVYAYAANMYTNVDGIKFVKVDGVEPTDETISSGEYPLIDYTYAIYNKSKAGSNVTDLIEWLLTDAGKEAMKNAGYIPVA